MRHSSWARNLWLWLWQDAYLWDWIVAAVAIIVHETVPDAITPRDRFYTPGDPSLMYPYRANTIPPSLLYALVFALPGVIYLVYAVWRRTPADGHHALLSLAEAFALATGWKRWVSLVGRLRPNWFATLMLHDAGKERDAREAYPSGHAAYMFFSMTLLACWALGKLHVLSRPGKGQFAKFLLCVSPLWLAQYVAATRLADYKHDFSDVNAGCFIGICSGLLAYFINYPSLLAYDSHLPKLRGMASPFDPAPCAGVGPVPRCWPQSASASYPDLEAQTATAILQQPINLPIAT